MKDSTWRIIIFSLFMTGFFCLNCCKKPESQSSSNNKGTLVLKFHITGGGAPFALNQTITNTTGQRYYFTVFSFYASNVTLTGSNNQSLAPILLIDPTPAEIVENPAQVDTLFVFNDVPAGAYTGLQFGIGPDSQQNMQGCAVNAYITYSNTYSVNYPLANNFSQYYWSTTLGYLFFTAQGKFDASTNNMGSIDSVFEYHCGTNPYFSTKTITSPITITPGSTTIFTINLETNDIFNAPNVINLKFDNSLGGDEITHTTDNPVLAKQLLQNLSAALKTN